MLKLPHKPPMLLPQNPLTTVIPPHSDSRLVHVEKAATTINDTTNGHPEEGYTSKGADPCQHQIIQTSVTHLHQLQNWKKHALAI